MPQKRYTEEVMRTAYDLVKQHDGFVQTAAKAVGIPCGTLSKQYHAAVDRLGLPPLHGRPNYTTWSAPPIAAVGESPDRDADPVVIRRLRDELERLKRENATLAKRAGAAEDLRSAVMGLAAEPVEPITFQAEPGGKHQRETAILFLSDLHWGEVIDIAAMDGINSYNLDIARARLRRCFAAAVDLMTEHWPGPPPERVIVVLGGDLCSGGIHLELAKTDALSPLASVRDIVAYLAAGLRLILDALPCPVDVISLPGNHGRITQRPESKGNAASNIDIIVADFLESEFRGEPRVAFYSPASGDALVSVYTWQVLMTHGDRIGSRGGSGFVGPAATAARGFKRLIADYSARGNRVDLILCGHFHVELALEEGFVNGCLPGPSEWARDMRFRPRPASQLLLAIHPRRGVTQARRIQVGHPDEGTIYAPPPAAAERPRYRVPAVSQRV